MLPATSEKKKTIFRRIHGRVVPIRVKNVMDNASQNRKEAIKGFTAAAAGIAAGAAAGKAYRAINNISTRKSTRAFRSLERITAFTGTRQGNFFSMVSKNKAQQKALGALNKARTIGEFAAPLRIGGRLVASALIGVGAANLYKSLSNKEANSDVADAIGSTAAIGAFFVGSHGAAGFRQSIKPFFIKAYPHIRRLKGLLRL